MLSQSAYVVLEGRVERLDGVRRALEEAARELEGHVPRPERLRRAYAAQFDPATIEAELTCERSLAREPSLLAMLLALGDARERFRQGVVARGRLLRLGAMPFEALVARLEDEPVAYQGVAGAGASRLTASLAGLAGIGSALWATAASAMVWPAFIPLGGGLLLAGFFGHTALPLVVTSTRLCVGSEAFMLAAIERVSLRKTGTWRGLDWYLEVALRHATYRFPTNFAPIEFVEALQAAQVVWSQDPA
jgi:hypothetical protein